MPSGVSRRVFSLALYIATCKSARADDNNSLTSTKTGIISGLWCAEAVVERCSKVGCRICAQCYLGQ